MKKLSKKVKDEVVLFEGEKLFYELNFRLHS